MQTEATHPVRDRDRSGSACSRTPWPQALKPTGGAVGAAGPEQRLFAQHQIKLRSGAVAEQRCVAEDRAPDPAQPRVADRRGKRLDRAAAPVRAVTERLG